MRPHYTHITLATALALLCAACPGDEETSPESSAISDMPADLSTLDAQDMSADMRSPQDMHPALDQGSPMADQGESRDTGVISDMAEPIDMTPEEPVNPLCELGASTRQATGSDILISPNQSALAEALKGASPGDRIVLEAGLYEAESLDEVTFASDVFIEAAPGAEVTMQGLSCTRCAHLVFRGIDFVSDPGDDAQRHVVNLDASSHITFDGVSMNAPPGQSTLRIYGQRNGACDHIEVYDSEISGGQRTVFILGKFAPSEQWNHTMTFARNTFTCGTSTCMQVSGGRDLLLADNTIRSTKGVGLLTAGATRIDVRRNVFEGSADANVAMNLATPGKQWDNFNGVEHMISSDLHIINNLVVGWANVGIQLNAVKDVDIAHNTLVVPTGLRTSHRTPQKWMSEEVILQGNQEYRLWHNIIDRITVDDRDPRPEFESHNLVLRGGAGDGLIELDAMLAGAPDYELSPGSPAINAGQAMPEQMPVELDRFGHTRETPSDLGALELGSTLPQCP
jgi:hypothetical protein